MKAMAGSHYIGPAGTATEIIATEIVPVDEPRPDWAGTVSCWWLNCPGQSPAWRLYVLSVIHLRPIEGVPPAVIRVPGASHEVIVAALDPDLLPIAIDLSTWRMLSPLNVREQVRLPDDAAARRLAHLCARAVVNGGLPAEPGLSGAVEPWRTTLIKSSAHLRRAAVLPNEDRVISDG